MVEGPGRLRIVPARDRAADPRIGAVRRGRMPEPGRAASIRGRLSSHQEPEYPFPGGLAGARLQRAGGIAVGLLRDAGCALSGAAGLNSHARADSPRRSTLVRVLAAGSTARPGILVAHRLLARRPVARGED